MFGQTRCNVKGGRIRSVCPKCKKVQYIAVSPTATHKIFRCNNCGQSNTYMLNHRHYLRNSLSGSAELVVNDCNKFKVLLNDISPAGIGFTILKGGRRVGVNKDAFINYKITGGSKIIRKIKIKNNSGTKVGALFVDRLAKLAQSF